VERDFRDAATQRRIRWEREDGIWNGDWREGDFRALAGRYAAATRKQASLDAKASQLASKAGNAGESSGPGNSHWMTKASRTSAAAVAGSRTSLRSRPTRKPGLVTGPDSFSILPTPFMMRVFNSGDA